MEMVNRDDVIKLLSFMPEIFGVLQKIYPRSVNDSVGDWVKKCGEAVKNAQNDVSDIYSILGVAYSQSSNLISDITNCKKHVREAATVIKDDVNAILQFLDEKEVPIKSIAMVNNVRTCKTASGEAATVIKDDVNAILQFLDEEGVPSKLSIAMVNNVRTGKAASEKAKVDVHNAMSGVRQVLDGSSPVRLRSVKQGVQDCVSFSLKFSSFVKDQLSFANYNLFNADLEPNDDPLSKKVQDWIATLSPLIVNNLLAFDPAVKSFKELAQCVKEMDGCVSKTVSRSTLDFNPRSLSELYSKGALSISTKNGEIDMSGHIFVSLPLHVSFWSEYLSTLMFNSVIAAPKAETLSMTSVESRGQKFMILSDNKDLVCQPDIFEAITTDLQFHMASWFFFLTPCLNAPFRAMLDAFTKAANEKATCRRSIVVIYYNNALKTQEAMDNVVLNDFAQCFPDGNATKAEGCYFLERLSCQWHFVLGDPTKTASRKGNNAVGKRLTNMIDMEHSNQTSSYHEFLADILNSSQPLFLDVGIKAFPKVDGRGGKLSVPLDKDSNGNVTVAIRPEVSVPRFAHQRTPCKYRFTAPCDNNANAVVEVEIPSLDESYDLKYVDIIKQDPSTKNIAVVLKLPVKNALMDSTVRYFIITPLKQSSFLNKHFVTKYEKNVLRVEFGPFIQR